MRTAEDWHQRGLEFEDLSRGADSSREYENDIARSEQAFDLERALERGLTTADDWCGHAVAVVALAKAGTSDLQGDLADAVEAFDRALSIDPSHHRALRERGFTLALLSQPDAALDSFVAAASQRPDDAELLMAVARELVKVRQFDRALSAFEKVLQLRPGDEEATLGRARVLVTLGRDELALAAWDQVLLQGRATPPRGFRDPRERRWMQAVFGRALILEKLGRPEAFAAFSLLIEEESKRIFPLFQKEFNQTLKTCEVARAAFRRHLETRTSDERALQTAGAAWLEAGQPLEALAVLNALLVMDPRNADAWFAKGQAHSQGGQLEAAIAAYQQALTCRPDFVRAAEQLKILTARPGAGARADD